MPESGVPLQGRRRPRCIACAGRAVHRHHTIYEQHIEREGGDVADDRNLVWVCFQCHGAHHGRSAPLELGMLPDSVFAFAFDLLGPASFDYMRRRYSGDDPRLEALLSG